MLKQLDLSIFAHFRSIFTFTINRPILHPIGCAGVTISAETSAMMSEELD